MLRDKFNQNGIITEIYLNFAHQIPALMKKHIPNFITSLNLATGFIAVIFILNGDSLTASWLILLAMVFDFLDGFASRILKAYSDLGKELDSLADMVSFGVVPGLIIYSLLSTALLSAGFGSSGNAYLYKILICIVSALFPVCAGLRLAKFNIDPSQTSSFKGLPTPGAALAVVTLLLASVYSASESIQSLISSPLLVSLFSIIISLLMVSRLPLLSFKFKTWGVKANEGRYTLILVSGLLILVLGWGGIPLIIPSYIAVSLAVRTR
jgi:CDP-diacylglycerol---serine O-phosphatidyltransferase